MDSAKSRQEMKDLKLCERITETLGGDGPQRVLLIGKSGIGKTRLARKVSEHVTKEGLCYLTLWLHLNNKFVDKRHLYENIAFQIEVYDREEEEKKSHWNKSHAFEEKVSTELRRKKTSAEEKMKMLLSEKNAVQLAQRERKHASSAQVVPYLLVILDDEGNKTSEDTVMKTLDLDSLLKHELDLKVLITRKDGDGNTTQCDDETEPRDDEDESECSEEIIEEERHDTCCEEIIKSDPDAKYHGEIVFRTTDESQVLHETFTKDYLEDLFESLIKDEGRHFLESLKKDWKIEEPLKSCVAQKSMSLPAAVVVLAKSLNCITKAFKSVSPKVKERLKEVLFPCGPAYAQSSSESTVELSRYNPVLLLAYELLETDNTTKNAIVDCFWHSLDFLKHCGCVSPDELIAQWILEGYFDPVQSVKKAYMDGHKILVELIKRGILKTQEDDMVVSEMAMSHLADLRHHGLLGRSQLQFFSLILNKPRPRFYVDICEDKKLALGIITQIDDMIKTVGPERRTILVSGNRLRRETSEKFFQRMGEYLEVLGLFSPTVDPLIPCIIHLLQLRVLVIRDCDLLSDIEELRCLSELTVLEVSGASCLRAISDEFFLGLDQLQSLNLSGLRIKHSPSSISQLKLLHSLILRDCPLLEDLPDLQYLIKLKVVDVCGARQLRTCFGMEENTSRNRTFSRLKQLQLLDFSETKVKRLPIFHDAAEDAKLQSLTRLSLCNCSNLIRLPSLQPLLGLQILDLSGTTSLVEIMEACFKQKEELKILNLSGTKFTKLPSTISGLSNLSQFLLRDSPNIEIVPNIKGLTSLEVFDVSGCTMLQKIEGSFEDMSYLREVNVSGTKIETFPELPAKSRMCCLKLAVLADSRRLEHDTWSQVKEAIANSVYESLGSSEISSKKLEKVDERWAFREHLYQGHLYRDIYINTIPFLDTENYQEVLEIKGSNGIDQDKETLAKAEFVAFVDNSAASLSSILSDLKSVKGCWLEMCMDVNIALSGVDEKCLKYLETLSITNCPLLDYICSSSFNNLKKLNLDCCPSIKTLFPASAPSTSLEVLKINFCEKLEKVFQEEVVMLKLHTLCLFSLPVLSTINAILPNLETYKNDKCPMLKTLEEDLRGLGKGVP